MASPAADAAAWGVAIAWLRPTSESRSDMVVVELDLEPALEAVVVREALDADRRAAAQTGLGPEHVAQQVGASGRDQVHVGEVGRRRHEAEVADQAADAVERADGVADARQAVEAGLPCRLVALLDRDLATEPPRMHRPARPLGHVPR